MDVNKFKHIYVNNKTIWFFWRSFGLVLTLDLQNKVQSRQKQT